MRGRLRERELDTDRESFEATVTRFSEFSWTERYPKKNYLRVARRNFGEEKEICVRTCRSPVPALRCRSAPAHETVMGLSGRAFSVPRFGWKPWKTSKR